MCSRKRKERDSSPTLCQSGEFMRRAGRKTRQNDKFKKYFKLGVDNSMKRVYDSERQMFATEKHEDRTEVSIRNEPRSSVESLFGAENR